MHFIISSAICYNLDQSKILSPGNGLNVTMRKAEMTESIDGKGENASYQHFLLFQQYFQKNTSTGLL